MQLKARMKSLVATLMLLAVGLPTKSALAQPFGPPVEPLPPQPEGTTEREAPPPAPGAPHPTPALKLSYERYSAGNVDGTAMPLEAAHLDMYPISWPFFRVGVELEAGRGHASLLGATASVKYGLVGGNLGVQIPGRVTPFLEGRLAAGVLGGSLDGPLMIPGTTVTVSGVSAATWMYARGVDAGAELYALGRAYLSLGLGWVRTSWGSANYDAMVASMGGSGIKFESVNHDSFFIKAGLGI
jgi:hypothetical protein